MLDQLTPEQRQRYYSLQRDNTHIPVDELVMMIVADDNEDSDIEEVLLEYSV